MKLPVLHTVFVDEFGDLHVVAAILCDLRQFTFLEPADRLQAFRRFFHVERCCGDGIQRKPVAERFIQDHEHVERGQLREVECRIAVQHLVIESQIIEAHHEIGALQVGDQVIHLLLAVYFIFAGSSAVSHAHAHAHLGNVAPAAYFLGGFLRFQVEIDDVLGHAQIYDLRFTIYELFPTKHHGKM